MHEIINDDQDLDAMVDIDIMGGTLMEHSQLNDYAFRGQELLDMSFFDFCISTYEVKLNTKQVGIIK
jgi:hypothetical protein